MTTSIKELVADRNVRAHSVLATYLHVARIRLDRFSDGGVTTTAEAEEALKIAKPVMATTAKGLQALGLLRPEAVGNLGDFEWDGYCDELERWKRKEVSAAHDLALPIGEYELGAVEDAKERLVSRGSTLVIDGIRTEKDYVYFVLGMGLESAGFFKGRHVEKFAESPRRIDRALVGLTPIATRLIGHIYRQWRAVEFTGTSFNPRTLDYPERLLSAPSAT